MFELTSRVHDQCVFEMQIADQLRRASGAERMRLYGEVYDAYADQFPEHLPVDSRDAERIAGYEKSFLLRFVTASTVMVEIGPGRGHLAFTLAPLVARLYGVDVAALTDSAAEIPANFVSRLTDGINLPFDTGSVDLVVSNQLMEHLHPDDAVSQLREIHRILRKGGRYVCVTPSRVNGPHDCSGYFDDLPCPIRAGDYQALGLHLKEYTTQELLVLFGAAGFQSVRTWIGARGRYVRVPSGLIRLIETMLRMIRPGLRKRSGLLGVVLGNRICATK